MKTLIIGRMHAGEKNDITLLAKQLAERAGQSVEYAFFEDLVFSIGTAEGTKVSVVRGDSLEPLESYGLIMLFHWTADRVYADIAHAAALYAHETGVTVWNQETFAARSTTKLSQLMQLALHGETVPGSVFCLQGDTLLKYAETVGSWPLIVKDVTASRGRRNYLAQNQEELAGVLQEAAGHPMVLQEWIANDKSDLRFFVVNSKVGLVIRRSGPETSHLNNVSAGGSAEILPVGSIPDTTIAEVERVASLFGRELCGIDYMFDTDHQRYVFLEINGTPQIVNGVFVDEKIDAIVTGIKQVEGQ